MSPSYSAEPIPPAILQELLDQNWQNYDGNIPKPKIMEVNIPENTIEEVAQRFDLMNEDLVVIRTDTGGEQEKLRAFYQHKDINFSLLLELYTINSRQRLYDLKQEIRRIVHHFLHGIDEYQLIRYQGFTELTQNQYNVWQGQIRVTFESAGVTLDT